jgi:hypothetical protein
MHSSWTHLRTFSRIALASAGISKSIDIAGFLWFLLVGLEGWHKPAVQRRQRQTKFEAAAATVIPAHAGIQYAAAPVVDGDAGVYWIIRLRG